MSRLADSDARRCAAVIKAWNHYRANKTLSPRYRYAIKPGERFPEPK